MEAHPGDFAPSIREMVNISRVIGGQVFFALASSLGRKYSVTSVNNTLKVQPIPHKYGCLNMDSLPSLYLWKVRPFSWTKSYMLELTEALDAGLMLGMFSEQV